MAAGLLFSGKTSDCMCVKHRSARLVGLTCRVPDLLMEEPVRSSELLEWARTISKRDWYSGGCSRPLNTCQRREEARRSYTLSRTLQHSAELWPAVEPDTLFELVLLFNPTDRRPVGGTISKSFLFWSLTRFIHHTKEARYSLDSIRSSGSMNILHEMWRSAGINLCTTDNIFIKNHYSLARHSPSHRAKMSPRAVCKNFLSYSNKHASPSLWPFNELFVWILSWIDMHFFYKDFWKSQIFVFSLKQPVCAIQVTYTH